MARKSSMQRQRELSLRGRNIVRQNEDDSNETTENSTNGGVTTASTDKRPDVEIVDKVRNLHELLGIPELEITTDEEIEEDEQPENTCEGQKQSIIPEPVKQSENTPNNSNMLQIMHEDVEEEIEYWK
ncbi:hypothetical protein vseg_016022 [Gypsophila vaccaria]